MGAVRETRVKWVGTPCACMKFSQERLEECTDEEINFIECPECGYDDSDTSRGISMHFAYNHEGSISYAFRCEQCEEIHFGTGQTNRFCSKDCETMNRVGTLKHQDEDFLRQRIEKDGVRAVEVADELEVDPNVVWKWVEKYDIGNEFECPSDGCERGFATRQGVSKHHINEHGESISGFIHVCRKCGDEFVNMKSSDNHLPPQFCSRKCTDTSSETITVEQTGHEVSSTWEAEIDVLLYKSGIDYEYESKTYSISDTTNKPDFEGEDWIIEVKGYGGYRDKDRYEEIGEYFVHQSDKEYILVGDEQYMPCNTYVPWNKREEVISIVE